MYLRSVLRSTSRLPAISLSERPACQCIKISVTSITSNVLLAIGLPSSTGGKAALSRWPGPPRHARHPHGELRERGGELRERQPLKPGNYVSADSQAESAGEVVEDQRAAADGLQGEDQAGGAVPVGVG